MPAKRLASAWLCLGQALPLARRSRCKANIETQRGRRRAALPSAPQPGGWPLGCGVFLGLFAHLQRVCSYFLCSALAVRQPWRSARRRACRRRRVRPGSAAAAAEFVGHARGLRALGIQRCAVAHAAAHELGPIRHGGQGVAAPGQQRPRAGCHQHGACSAALRWARMAARSFFASASNCAWLKACRSASGSPPGVAAVPPGAVWPGKGAGVLLMRRMVAGSGAEDGRAGAARQRGNAQRPSG